MTEPRPAPPSPWGRRVIGPFALGHLVMLVGVVVLSAGLLMLLNTPISAPAAPTPQAPGSGFYRIGEPTTGLAIGDLAPELEGVVNGEVVPLHDLEGDVISLAELRGHPVWLNFFATWCPPCQEETPVLRDTYERYVDDGLELVAVSVQETTLEDVAAYAETYSLPYTIGFDTDGVVFDTYAGFGLPTHVFVDADGVIRHLRYGPLTRAQAAELIEPLLGG